MMERRLLLAIVISVVILLGYNYLLTKYYSHKYPHLQKEISSSDTTPAELTQKQEKPSEQVTTGAKIKKEVLFQGYQEEVAPLEGVLENNRLKVVWSNQGARIKQIYLKQYKTKQGEIIKLVGRLNRPSEYSGIFWLWEDASFPGQMAERNYQVVKKEGKVVFRLVTEKDEKGSQFPEGILIEKSFWLEKDKYVIYSHLKIQNLNSQSVQLKQATLKTDQGIEQGGLLIYLGEGLGPNEVGYLEKSLYDENFVYLLDGDLERSIPYRKVQNKKKREQKVLSGVIDFLGLENRYFLVGYLPRPSGRALLTEVDSQKGMRAFLLLPVIELPPREVFEYTGLIYAGDKRTEDLVAVDESLKPLDGLEPTILPFSIARLMVSFLRGIYSVIPNYGVAIIILTIVVRLALYPLTHQSMKSMRRMQQLQPKIQKLKQKYGKNRDEFNKAMMALYRQEKVNPMGGCLPMVLQIPIFIGLFIALRNAVELRGAEFFWWIKDLSLPDTVYILPFEIPILSLFMGRNINILPIIYAFTMWWSSRMNTVPAQTQEQQMQQNMMKFLPVMITVFFWNFPSGLFLYFTVSNILQIIQQAVINKTLGPMPLATTENQDSKEANHGS